MNRKDEIKFCLDEIDAAYGLMIKRNANKKKISMCKGWVKKHKDILKGLKYRGKIPRQPKIKGNNQ